VCMKSVQKLVLKLILSSGVLGMRAVGSPTQKLDASDVPQFRILFLDSCAMTQTVHCRPLRMEVHVNCQSSQFGCCNRQKVALGKVFPLILQFPLSVSFHHCSILGHFSVTDIQSLQVTAYLNNTLNTYSIS
jgi:hypothetical protein